MASVAFSLSERGNPIRNLRGVQVPDISTLGDYLSALSPTDKPDASPSVAPLPVHSGHSTTTSLAIGSTTVKPRERPKGTSPMVGPGIVLLPGSNSTTNARTTLSPETSHSPPETNPSPHALEMVGSIQFSPQSNALTPPTPAENLIETCPPPPPPPMNVLTPPGLIAPPPLPRPLVFASSSAAASATLFNDELDSFALLAASATPPLNVIPVQKLSGICT